MKRFALAVAGASLAAFLAAPTWAQSAKFSATWADDPEIVDTGLVVNENGTPVTGAEADLATIHVAQQKDLLIGVSAQIGIFTLTQAKGKSGNTATSIARGEVGVTVRMAPEGAVGVCSYGLGEVAEPGEVTFAARLQELSVTNDSDDAVIVKLVLDTTAAHHFNFLGIDLDQGTYDVWACFDLEAFANVIEPNGDGQSKAKVTLGKRVVSVQEVRAAKNSIIEDDN